MPDFLPQRETALAAWLDAFAARIAADPEAWDVKPSDAAELADRYALYATAQAKAIDPQTRTAGTMITRDQMREALVTVVRRIAWTVRKSTVVTDAERFLLGLKIAKTGLTPVNVPATKPIALLTATRSHALRVRLADESTPTRVAKPQRVMGAQVYVHLGEAPPERSSEWMLHSTQTNTRFEISFDGNLPYGQLVWVCARWLDTRGRPGPTSTARNVRLLGGVAGPHASLSIAA